MSPQETSVHNKTAWVFHILDLRGIRYRIHQCLRHRKDRISGDQFLHHNILFPQSVQTAVILRSAPSCGSPRCNRHSRLSVCSRSSSGVSNAGSGCFPASGPSNFRPWSCISPTSYAGDTKLFTKVRVIFHSSTIPSGSVRPHAGYG